MAAIFKPGKRKLERLRKNPRRAKPYAESTKRRFRSQLNAISAQIDQIYAEGLALQNKAAALSEAFFANEERIQARSKAAEKGWNTRWENEYEAAITDQLAQFDAAEKKRGKRKKIKLEGEAKPHVTRIDLSKMSQEEIVELTKYLREKGVKKLRFSRFTDRNIYPGGEGEYATGWRWSGRWTDMRRKTTKQINDMIGLFMTSSYVKSVDVSVNDMKNLPKNFQMQERQTPESEAERRKLEQDMRKAKRKEKAKAKKRRDDERKADAMAREIAAEKKASKLMKKIDALWAQFEMLRAQETALREKLA